MDKLGNLNMGWIVLTLQNYCMGWTVLTYTENYVNFLRHNNGNMKMEENGIILWGRMLK